MSIPETHSRMCYEQVSGENTSTLQGDLSVLAITRNGSMIANGTAGALEGTEADLLEEPKELEEHEEESMSAPELRECPRDTSGRSGASGRRLGGQGIGE